MNQLGEIFKNGRTRKSLTQAELSLLVGIERKTYSTYETGRNEPDLDSLGKIVRALSLGEEIKMFFMEQNVPHETIQLVPAPETDMDKLSDWLKELQTAAAEVQKMIFDKISSEKIVQVLQTSSVSNTGQTNQEEQKETF